ncbi:MAG: ATP-dependent DNA helicase UvrD2, partial [Ilumatobacteraceae bacterium]
LFPNAGAHPLEVNYRCPADVVEAADRLMRHNRRRVAKTIRPNRQGTEGLQLITAEETLTATVDVIASAVERGRRPEEVAVLTRVNALLAPVQLGLLAAGVPVRGGVGTEFISRTAIRAALAWVRLSVSQPDTLDGVDLAEALRRPSRPLHPNVANWVAEQTSLGGLGRLAGRVNNDRDAARIATFRGDIARLQRLAATGSTADVLRALADEIGLGASIVTLDDGRRGMNRAAQNDDLVALAQLATLQPDPSAFGPWLCAQLALPRSAGVALATVHRVKGQEWPVVVVHHAEANQYPHRLAEDLEEERRIFHVAITRGAQHVIVVSGAEPSPFIAEMQNEPPALAERGPAPSRSRPAADATGRKPAGETSVFAKGSVLVAPGLVLVDGGQDWVITTVEDAGAVARFGAASRRFAFGAAVVTKGRQRGSLRAVGAAAGAAPVDASVRAHDLLRQLRERLRDGKPAYVVFDDKTLEAIALALPASLQALGRVGGIGPTKLEQYGDAVLAIVEDAVAGVAGIDGGLSLPAPGS